MGENSSEDERTMWVGNIHSKVTEELLWELFLQAGPLESVKIAKDYKTGRQKNFAFVRFQHKVSVKYVIDLMDGIPLFKMPLKLSVKNTPSASGSGPDTMERQDSRQRRHLDERNEGHFQTRGPAMNPNLPHHPDSPWDPMPGDQMMQFSPHPNHPMSHPNWPPTPPDFHGYGDHRESDSYGEPKWHANAEQRARNRHQRDELVMRRSHSIPNHMHDGWNYDRKHEPYRRHERERRRR